MERERNIFSRDANDIQRLATNAQNHRQPLGRDIAYRGPLTPRRRSTTELQSRVDGDASSKRKRVADVIDLLDDDEELAPTPSKRQRFDSLVETQSEADSQFHTTQSPAVECSTLGVGNANDVDIDRATIDDVNIDPVRFRGLPRDHISLDRPTEIENTQAFKKRDLASIPEIDPRYVPRYSLEDGVEYVNPRIFGLKPAFWKRWEPKHYIAMAEELRYAFDPVPLAQRLKVPVEEVQHVFTSLLINPLYNAKEARKRGEDGMCEIFDAHNKYATPTRPWGKVGEKGAKRVFGELTGVAKSTVMLTLKNGAKHQLGLSECGKEDIKYLRETLSRKRQDTLWDKGSVEGAKPGL